MAQRVEIILDDDIDGGPADETLGFTFDGTKYEIDLSSRNAAALRDALAPFIAHARKVGGRGRRGSPRAGRGGGDTAAIREWARVNGFKISDRGRISAEVMAAYEAR
ncbi:MAG: Lsr2 family protein [Candidatus Nanopelagicales bacterium]